jgi:cytochrome c oxidase subunit IV
MFNVQLISYSLCICTKPFSHFSCYIIRHICKIECNRFILLMLIHKAKIYYIIRYFTLSRQKTSSLHILYMREVSMTIVISFIHLKSNLLNMVVYIIFIIIILSCFLLLNNLFWDKLCDDTLIVCETFPTCK